MAQQATGAVLGVMKLLKMLGFSGVYTNLYPLRPPCHSSISNIRRSLLKLNQAFCSCGLYVRLFPSPLKSKLTDNSFYLYSDQVFL